jgi:hypothetical protein
VRDWASSGRVKIERANKHIRDLEARVTAFRKKGPYHVVPKLNSDGTEGATFTVRVVYDIPPDFSAITADAIHNLHVALEHLWQRALYGAKRNKGDRFPFYKSPECAKSRFRGKEKDRCKKAVDLLNAVEAFRKGNPFWNIFCFDNADKHDTLSLVACALTRFRSDVHHLYYGIPGPLLDFTFPSIESRIIKDGALLYSWNGPVSEMNVEHKLAFEIAFGKGEVLEHETVIPTLQHFSTSVEGLAAAFIEAGLLA